MVTGHVFYKSRIALQDAAAHDLAMSRTEEHRERLQARLDTLLAIEPVGRWNLVGTSLGLVVSFVIPIASIFR